MSLLQKDFPIDAPVEYPKTIGAARRLIKETFAENKYDIDEQKRYLKLLDITTEPGELNSDEMKKVLSEMAKDQMIIFAV